MTVKNAHAERPTRVLIPVQPVIVTKSDDAWHEKAVSTEKSKRCLLRNRRLGDTGINGVFNEKGYYILLSKWRSNSSTE